MATVLVSVALVAASIWDRDPDGIGPGFPGRACAARGHWPNADRSLPLPHPDTRPAARPVRCTQRSPQGRLRLHHPFPLGPPSRVTVPPDRRTMRTGLGSCSSGRGRSGLARWK